MLFPEPDAPTSATDAPAASSRLSPRSTGASGRVGYAKCTSRSETAPRGAPGCAPADEHGSMAERMSTIAKRRAAAWRAALQSGRKATAWPTPMAALRSTQKTRSIC